MRPLRRFCLGALLASSVVASACPRAEDAVDAGASEVVDAGAMTGGTPVPPMTVVDAGTVVTVAPLAPLAPDPLAFRFIRMRTPTAGGDEIVRIGLNERVRIADGVVVDERAAPSPEALAALVALCARRDVEAALRAPGDTAPSMTIIELGCAPVQGVVACEPGASNASSSSCAGAFVALRDAVTAASQEDSYETRAPEQGLIVQVTSWDARTALVSRLFAGNGAPPLVLYVDGKPLLPAKGEPFARAPKGKRALLCTDGAPDACTDVIAPARVHLDFVGGTQRFRCPSCAPAASRSPTGPLSEVPDIADIRHGALSADGILTKAHILTVYKRDGLPRVTKECARAAGPDVVKISWTIQPAGNVTDARDASQTSTARGRCAAAVMARLRFAPSKAATPVSIPIKVGQ